MGGAIFAVFQCNIIRWDTVLGNQICASTHCYWITLWCEWCNSADCLTVVKMEDKMILLCWLSRDSKSCFICSFFCYLISLKTHELISFTGLGRLYLITQRYLQQHHCTNVAPSISFFFFLMHSYLAWSPATAQVFQFSFQHCKSRCISTTLQGFSFPYQLNLWSVQQVFCCEITQQDE